MLRHFLTTGFTDRIVRIVIDFTTSNHRNHFIEQMNKATCHTRLRLTTFTKKNDILPRENGIFNLWNHSPLIANDTREKLFAIPYLLNEVFAHLLFDRE